MGQAASAIIAYGILVNEEDKEYILPWQSQEFDFDYEKWWAKKMGYVRPFEIYTSDGEDYIDGIEPSKEKISEYYEHKRQWLDENPMPFRVKLFGYEGNCNIIISPNYPYFEVSEDSITFSPSDLIFQLDEKFQTFVEEFLSNADSAEWILAAKLF